MRNGARLAALSPVLCRKERTGISVSLELELVGNRDSLDRHLHYIMQSCEESHVDVKSDEKKWPQAAPGKL